MRIPDAASVRGRVFLTLQACLLLLSVAAVAQTRPPVILVPGYRQGCTVPATSRDSFGDLEQKLVAQGVITDFLRTCPVQPVRNYQVPPIEDLGRALRSKIESLAEAGYPEVDLIAYSMGNLIVRACLAGKENEDGVFKPPLNARVRKAVFIAGPHFGVDLPAETRALIHGPLTALDVQRRAMVSGGRFLWDLATWNQGTDDLRGVDAIAIVGDGEDIGNEPGDGSVTISSASISFAVAGERTRIIEALHNVRGSTPGVAMIDSDTHPSWRIINSFLAGTDEWKAIGRTPGEHTTVSRTGGVFLALKDGQDEYLDIGQASLSGIDLYPGALTFFKDYADPGEYVPR
jgi:hypothetical protein